MIMVLKVSGHLYKHQDKVRELMKVLEDLVEKSVGVVVIPGGSIFADIVKEFQALTSIDDDVAHWMAIKAMEIYGLYLTSFSRKTIEVYTVEDIVKALNNKLISVLMPYGILRNHDELPHSWNISSDSIAIYIAYLIKASLVVLGKMIKGIISRNGSIIHQIRAEEATRFIQNEFDEYVIPLLKRFKIPLVLFDITRPWLLYRIVELSPDEYTLIVP